LLATFKNQSLLTLNFLGESHEKGEPEDADMKASWGVLRPLEAFFLLYQLFQSKPKEGRRDVK